MAFIDHSYKTCVEAEELTAPPEGSIFTCEWTHHPHGYYLIGLFSWYILINSHSVVANLNLGLLCQL